MPSYKPSLTSLESRNLLSTLHHTPHQAPHHTPHQPAAHVVQHQAPKGHVSPHADAALPTVIKGNLANAVTPPALDNAPYTVLYSGRIVINGTTYASATVEGTISTQTHTGTLSVATSDGNLNLSVITLNDTTEGNYTITGGTDKFANSVGTGILSFSGSDVAFNAHQLKTPSATGTPVRGPATVDTQPTLSNWSFSGSANLRIGSTIYPSQIVGYEDNQVGNITITTSVGTITMNIETTYDVSGGNYTITSGTGVFDGIAGTGVIFIRNNSIAFNPHQYA